MGNTTSSSKNPRRTSTQAALVSASSTHGSIAAPRASRPVSLNLSSPHRNALGELQKLKTNFQATKQRSGATLLRELEITRDYLRNGDESRARLSLRRRKYQINLIRDGAEGLKALEKLILDHDYEFAKKEIKEGLKQGSHQLQKLQREISLDSVERLLGNSAEAHQFQHEVASTLAEALTKQDDEEVTVELQAIEKEMNEEKRRSLKGAGKNSNSLDKNRNPKDKELPALPKKDTGIEEKEKEKGQPRERQRTVPKRGDGASRPGIPTVIITRSSDVGVPPLALDNYI